MRWLFAASMAVGVAMVVVGLRSAEEAKRPSDSIAMVGGVPIRTAKIFGRAKALAGGADADALTLALDAAIIEEILFQRALSQRVHETDAVIRARMVQGVQDLAVSDATAQAPTEDELRRYHAAHRGAFAGPHRYRFDEIFLPRREGDDRRADAAVAWARLKTETWDAVRADHPDPPPAPPTDAMRPADRINQRYGPSFLRALRTLDVGAISRPIRTQRGYHLLRLRASEPGPPLELAEAEAAVRSRYLRAAEKAAYAEYVAAARREADVWIAPDAVARLRAAIGAPADGDR